MGKHPPLVPTYTAGPASPEAAARDVRRQRRHEGERGLDVESLQVRVDGARRALTALEQNEDGAVWALRQAFIDVAAAAEELAARMRAPTRPFEAPRYLEQVDEAAA